MAKRARDQNHAPADAWFAAMKAGRTFVTNGPMMELTVNGAIPGDELRVARNEDLRIRARGWAPASIGAPKTLEIIAHGQVIHSTESNNPDKQELTIEISLNAEAGQWIAARVTSHNGAFAHTSPVYVWVDGEIFRNKKELPRLVDKRLKVLDFNASRLNDPKYTAQYRYSMSEVEALTSEMDEARTRYRQLLAQG
ncbi:MAG: CehA/McbA family metallohydrolase [Terriglobia bacterium]